MDTPGLTIYNVPAMPPKWDRVGVFYIAFAATWTTIVAAGMAFCWYNRHLAILRVRNLPLAFSGLIFLHLYWIMAQITYPIGATMPIVIAYDTQYFIMGTWFPLGIALFHASNLRFLRIARLQKQFAHPDLKRKRGCNGTYSLFCRIRNMDYDTKVMTFIIIGLVIQVRRLLCYHLHKLTFS
jgi:fatty acid desaturase